MIPDEHLNAVEKFPICLQQLIQAELAAGNSIVDVKSGSPAPPVGSCLQLAKSLLTRPRLSDSKIHYYLRNNSRYSGEITDKQRIFFLLEPPLEPGAYVDMNHIRAALEAEQRVADADMDRSSRS
jgi:extradiol dioxygenase family protein